MVLSVTDIREFQRTRKGETSLKIVLIEGNQASPISISRAEKTATILQLVCLKALHRVA